MVQIVERTTVQAAMTRALELVPDRDAAALAVAQALGLSPEAVHEAAGPEHDESDSEGGELDVVS
tara:strand:+ start:3181 stop:3375 length:195 start_codon:yes stop_codon:yes gene_type:complete